jgi:lipopolysaccharide transport system permease protein
MRRPMLLGLLDPRPYVRAFAEVVRILLRNRTLMREVVRRELRGQHSGLLLGRLWGVIQPLFLMLVYTVIFGLVFRARTGNSVELPRDYSVYILSGMVPWLAFVQAMARGSGAITDNAALVKQTVFQLEVLPVARAATLVVPLAVGLAFVAVLTAATSGLPVTFLLVPVLLLLELVAMAGAAFCLSAVGALVRDVRELVQILSVIGIFVLPIVYLPGSVPRAFQPVLYANPFSYVIWCFQDAIYFGRFEHPWAWPAFGVGTLIVFAVGYRIFRHIQPLFGNVL